MARGRGAPALPYSQHAPKDWDLPRGLLYSLTLITTIGSGCEGVESGLGRLASLVYLVVGLPLILLYLHRLGRLLANCVRCICCSFPPRSLPGHTREYTILKEVLKKAPL